MYRLQFGVQLEQMSTAWDTNHYENFSLCYEILGISVNTTRKHVIHFCPTTKKKTFGKLYSGIKCKHSLEQKGQHYTTLKKNVVVDMYIWKSCWWSRTHKCRVCLNWTLREWAWLVASFGLPHDHTLFAQVHQKYSLDISTLLIAVSSALNAQWC